MARQIFGMVGLALAVLLHPTAGRAQSTEDLDAITRRGQQLYALDKAAWVATDALLAQVRDPAALRVAGWIVVEHDQALRVIFYRAGPEASAAFTADVSGDKVLATHVAAEDEDSRLSPLEARMVRARQVASEQETPRCTDSPMNTVVIPSSAPDDVIEVYVLSAQVKSEEIPFGGHYRFDIAPDGKVVGSRKFTRGCLNLSTASPDADATPAGLMLTHLLDPIPTEIHVFSAKAAGAPVFVMASDQSLWEVTGDAIRAVSAASR